MSDQNKRDDNNDDNNDDQNDTPDDEPQFEDGDIVWVKFQRIYWPAEFIGEENHPPQLYKPNRRPAAVLRFFREQSYICVYDRREIMRYNCIRKNEFLKKGNGKLCIRQKQQ